MRLKKRFILLFTIVVLIYIVIKSDWVTHRLYPISYEHEIQEYAQKYEIDTHLIAAIIRVESNFRTGQASSKGASGLMQIMPSTAEWISGQAQLKTLSEDSLMNSVESNIELGSWYIKYLMDKYNHELIISLAAYNAGPGNVDKWLNNGIWDGTLTHVEQIPYGETRKYVQKVIYYYNKYKEIYPDFE